jgi:hypothetical protein
MGKLLTILPLIFILYSYDNSNKKNDLVDEHLYGNVKSLREFSYNAVEKNNGELLEGEKDFERFLSFNDKGNITEYKTYNSNGTLNSRSISVYRNNKRQDSTYDSEGQPS